MKTITEIITDITTVFNTLTSERDALRVNIGELESNANVAQTEINTLTADRASLISERDSLAAERDSLTSELASVTSELEALLASIIPPPVEKVWILSPFILEVPQDSNIVIHQNGDTLDKDAKLGLKDVGDPSTVTLLSGESLSACLSEIYGRVISLSSDGNIRTTGEISPGPLTLSDPNSGMGVGLLWHSES